MPQAILTPTSPERQKHYKGHVTIRARVASLIDAGELDNYTKEELAIQLHCSVRTIEAYIGMLTRTELAEVTPDMLPLVTSCGRMLIMSDREYGSCESCPFVEMCNFLIRRDAMLVCEKPLLKEVYPSELEETDGNNEN